VKHIGIISDTHGYWDDKYEYYLGECDEIWHAGDIGSVELADRLQEELFTQLTKDIQAEYLFHGA